METATLIYEGLTTYFWIGMVVATLFLVIAIDRIDPNAHGAFIFRVLLIPGIIVLWPLVLLRWAVLELKGAGEERPAYESCRSRQGLVPACDSPAVRAAGCHGLAVAGPSEQPAVLLEAPSEAGACS
ncbi:MAG: hypothetical protein CMM46_15260 [Rhodospirillaceae bacterium]|nr:hypothetical protein [Rhodospirillaceae bacterium]